MNEILIYNPGKGNEIIDLRANGFDLLLQKDLNLFSFWMSDTLNSIHTVLAEQTGSVWMSYKENENKLKDERIRQSKVKRQQLVQKHEKNERVIGNNIRTMEVWRKQTIDEQQDITLKKYKKIRQEDIDRHKFMKLYWSKLKSQLTRERGIWGPLDICEFAKYKLDKTEGPYRMRKREKRNYKFYEIYPYVQGLQEGQHSIKIPTSLHCKYNYFKYGGGYTVHYPLTIPKPLSIISPHRNAASSSSINIQSNPGDVPASPLSKTPILLKLMEDELGGSGKSPRKEIAFHLDDSPTSGSANNAAASNTSVSRSSSKSESDQDQIFLEDEITDDNHSGDEDNDDFLEDDEFSSDEDEDKIQRMLETGDKIQSMYNCARIDGMIQKAALFIICLNNFYLIDGYKLSDDNEIAEIKDDSTLSFLQQGLGAASPHSPIHDQSITSSGAGGSPTSSLSQQQRAISNHSSRRWAFEDIKDIYKRRYLLRPVALEIFSTDGRNFLIVFEQQNMLIVYRLLTSKLSKQVISTQYDYLSSLPNSNIYSQSQDVENQSTSRFGVITSRFWKKETITQKWVQGQISNFQYLMHLNILAGRSYNDLTQYPLFPWVLADYESEYLNLNDPKVYRDLSKPMGAVNQGRANDFQYRYDHWEPRENDGVPKWHYGSHYSSAGIVLYYLIRMESFTQQFLNHLQSGRFDVADRLFHSIHETWLSASGATLNMSDVKELIHEFYYLHEFLMNKNKFELGKKQTGEIVDDIILPRWAHGSAYEFVRIHRQALESEYVSAHLHEWIDLIFGYKQQGKAAADALNVFYFLTYEGSIDIDCIDDPIEKDSVISQINNFGQTPKQIFKKPHPKRQILTTTQITRISDVVLTSHLFVKDIQKPVHFIQSIGEKLILAGPNRISLHSKSYNKFISWDYLDFSIRITYMDSEKISKVIENAHDGQLTCLCVSTDGKYIITGGTDSLIAVRKLKKIKGNKSFIFVKSLCGNLYPITHVAVSRSYSIIVSTAQDNTIIIWDLNRLCFVTQLKLVPEMNNYPISGIYINNMNGYIVATAGPYFQIWTINAVSISYVKASSTISSFVMSEICDWVAPDYVTGHVDGTIKVFLLPFSPSSLLPLLFLSLSLF